MHLTPPTRGHTQCHSAGLQGPCSIGGVGEVLVSCGLCLNLLQSSLKAQNLILS